MADTLIDSIASRQLGPDPSAEQSDKDNPDSKRSEETAEGAAIAEAEPTDAGPGSQDSSGSEEDLPVEYEIDFGDNEKRMLTPNQIRSTYGRYADLNHKMSQMSPVIKLAEKIISNSEGKVDAAQLAEAMETALRAGVKNPQMGNEEKGEVSGEAPDDELENWAKENAVSLPPGYADMRKENRDLRQQVERLANIMGQMVGKQRQGIDQFSQNMRSATQQVGQQSVNVVKQSIANNLARAQQQFQLPDSDEQAFMQFAAQRGYTVEDFASPDLTMTVAQDFVNAKNSGELERIRSVQSRRQAHTGSVASQPTGAAAAGSEEGSGDPMMDRMLATARRQRFG